MRLVAVVRSAGECRVKALGRPGVALSCLAHVFGMVATPRCFDTLHVLSIPYKLIGDNVAVSAELKKRTPRSADGSTHGQHEGAERR